MKIAVLSGKGGTGKTFIAVNLAEVMENSAYVDCDVEEPNGHLFFWPVWIRTETVYRKLPVINKALCNGCRLCTEFCKFNALAHINDNVMVFEDVCHSCGGCVHLCPQGAITEKDKPVGKIQYGKSLNTSVFTGTMLTKEASGIPIIDGLLDNVKAIDNVVIDCPPGSACSVMESIKEADYCILVAEPTIFGSHNLSMVHELVQVFNKPFGVVLNKCFEGENPSKDYCMQHNIPILKEIFYEDRLAKLQSEGKIAVRTSLQYWNLFMDLMDRIWEVYDETAVSS